MAHELFEPFDMAITLDVRDDTSMGHCVDVPVPSCPELLFPQHISMFVEFMTHADDPPADIALFPAPRVMSSIGVFADTYVPMPSCPTELPPQQNTAPVLVNAHVWLVPAEIAWTPESSSTTWVAMLLDAEEPSPSRPDPFEPQHSAAPPDVTAHACA